MKTSEICGCEIYKPLVHFSTLEKIDQYENLCSKLIESGEFSLIANSRDRNKREHREYKCNRCQTVFVFNFDNQTALDGFFVQKKAISSFNKDS